MRIRHNAARWHLVYLPFATVWATLAHAGLNAFERSILVPRLCLNLDRCPDNGSDIKPDRESMDTIRHLLARVGPVSACVCTHLDRAQPGDELIIGASRHYINGSRLAIRTQTHSFVHCKPHQPKLSQRKQTRRPFQPQP